MKKVLLFCACFTFFVLIFTVAFGNEYKGISLEVFEKPRKYIQNASDSLSAFVNQKYLMSENRLLKERLANLTTQTDYERIKSENEELKKSLALSEQKENKIIAARVTAINPDGNFRITLNRGANHGVSRGDVVVFGGALAGRISEVYPAYSVFVPITAEGIATGVSDKNNNPGIICGNVSLAKNNMCTISFFTESESAIGDEIITSGLSDVYPAGLLVGKIHSIDKNITVKTEIDFFKTRIFSVILSQ